MSSNQEWVRPIAPIAESIDQTSASSIEVGIGPGSPIEAQRDERDGGAIGFACFTSFTRATTARSAFL
ncbi:MAG: hypothetical protein O2985_15550 [Proteobacteria bacterium]|nr:hypothetical protein [Pseudomonadota bacterium]